MPEERERQGARAIARCFFAALFLCAGSIAMACPLCLGAFRATVSQQLIDSPHSLLARPSADGREYQVLEVIKGDRPADGTIPAEAVQVDFVVQPAAALLLVRDAGWSMWVGLGAAPVEHASWLRQIARGQRAPDMSEGDWQARVALMIPYLEDQEPLVAKIAYGELAAAPYAALLTAKPRLDATAIRRWLADPTLSARRPVYQLLLGVAGDPQDAAMLEKQIEAAWMAGDATSLGSAIAADLQLRGPSRMAWVDAKYLGDRLRSTKELEAALLALSVLGNADVAIPRERVIQSYLLFIHEHQELAGLVAWDLASWQYWGADPLYRAIIKSNVRQHFASQVAIFKYLAQSPAGNMTDLDSAKTGAQAQTGAERPAPPVLPQ
jgi:hypothetical protein